MHAAEPARRAGGRRHDLPFAGREGARACRRPRVSPTESRSACSTTATSSTGPYDAISSIGMFEHVGLAKLGEYFERLREIVVPGGRVLNHGISRPWSKGVARLLARELPRPLRVPRRRAPRDRRSGVRDAAARPRGASRRRPARALRARRCGIGSRTSKPIGTKRSVLSASVAAKVWRLYMAASALNFEKGGAQIHQVLAVRPDGGASHMPLRPDWGT